MKNSTLLDLDYVRSSRIRRLKKLYKPMSVLSRSLLANIMLIIFCLADFATLYTAWNNILTASPTKLVMIVLAFAVCLDITMGMCATAIKQFRAGLRQKKDTVWIVITCFCAFLIAYGLNLGLRLTLTDDMLQEMLRSSTVEDKSGTTEANDDIDPTESQKNTALWATISLAVIPLATSVGSFGVTYAVSDPIKERKHDLKKARIELQTDITFLKKTLAESEEPESIQTHIQRLIDREEDLYNTFLNEIGDIVLNLKTIIRDLIMEKLGTDADKITDVTENSLKVLHEDRIPNPPQKAAAAIPPENQSGDGYSKSSANNSEPKAA